VYIEPSVYITNLDLLEKILRSKARSEAELIEQMAGK